MNKLFQKTMIGDRYIAINLLVSSGENSGYGTPSRSIIIY